MKQFAFRNFFRLFFVSFFLFLLPSFFWAEIRRSSGSLHDISHALAREGPSPKHRERVHARRPVGSPVFTFSILPCRDTKGNL